MKRVILYIVILAALPLLPLRKTEIGKLQPVELISVDVEHGRVVIQTDTQDIGVGRTVEEAIENLKKTTSGIVFLDTADYLLVTKRASNTVPELSGYLKESVRICTAEVGVDPEKATEYLKIHPPKEKLKDFFGTEMSEFLREENGRLILE